MSKSILKNAKMAKLSAGRLRAILGLAVITALILTGLFARVRAEAEDIGPEAAGDLDSSFGTGGKVNSDLSLQASAGDSGAIQDDGKLVHPGPVPPPTR